jgi:hypothetical protein
MKIEPLISAKVTLVIIGIFILSGCSSPPAGYTNSGFPFFIEKANYPCAYKGFYSDGALAILTSGLDKEKYPSEKVVSISGTADTVNKDNQINSNNDTLSCSAEIAFSNGKKEKGVIHYAKGVNDSIVMSWMSDSDRAESKAKEAEAAKKAEADWQKEFSQERYPYFAFVNCNFMGNNAPLSVCYFNANISSSFEIRNGDKYFLYKGYDIWKAGDVKDGLLRIPLQEHFYIDTQNVSKHHVLNVRIIDRKNNTVVFEKSAGMFDYISIKN